MLFKEIRYSNFDFSFRKNNDIFELGHFFSILSEISEFFVKKKSIRKPNFFFEKLFFCRSHH